ncbi:MAG TPA: helix-turn-helix transcriptional regulator [Vicinamibacterales bacterium]|nr:helix-turn-helix transcriptional regulator [Vicinamibacterales bacterium]
MPRDPWSLLPLKPLVFEILLALADGERHGWALVRAVEARLHKSVLPGNLYRTLNAMQAEGLLDESAGPARIRARQASGGRAPRRFFRLSAFGRAVGHAEARRLAGLVEESRTKRFLEGGTR